jgi:hypothetical protein
MALNLASLASKKASLSFEFEGETVNAEFYPHKITPTYRALLGKLENQDEVDAQTKDATATMLSDLLVSWDVVAGDEPAPLTYECLLNVPTTLVGATARQIWEAVGKQISGESSS